MIEQVLHDDRFLHGRDGKPRGELVGQLGLAQAASGGCGLFKGVRPLQFSDLAFGGGHVGGKGFVTLAVARKPFGSAHGVEKIIIGRAGVELVRPSVVEVGELHCVVEALRAGRRECAVLLAVVANPLAADVDMPGEALRRLAADYLMERVIFVVGDRDADFDGPVVLGDVRGQLGLRVPTEPSAVRGGAVEIGHGPGRADGDLVIRARVGFEQDFDAVAIPERGVVLPDRADVRLLARRLVAADGKVEVVAGPSSLDRSGENRLAARLQFAEVAGGRGKRTGPGLVVEPAVNDDRAARLADQPQHRHGAALLAELPALAAQALEVVVDPSQAPAVHGCRLGLRLRQGEQRQRLIGLVLVVLHALPVRLAIFEEGEHLAFGGPIEEAAILAEYGVRILLPAAPVHPLGEGDEKVIQADARLGKVLPHAEPDIFALRDALGRVDARAHRVRREGGQVPAAVGERVILEDDDRIAGLRKPAFAQLADLLLLLGAVVDRPAAADDRHDYIRFQLVDLQWRERVRAVGAVEDLSVRMRLAHLSGDTVDEIPYIVGQQAALASLGRVLARAERALADRGVAVGGHHGDGFQPVMVELRANIAHGLSKELFAGVAELIEPLAGLVVAFAAVKRKPVGMLGENLVAMRHLGHAVGNLDAVGIASAESHRPHRQVAPVHAEADVEAADGEIGPYRLVDFRQPDRPQ